MKIYLILLLVGILPEVFHSQTNPSTETKRLKKKPCHNISPQTTEKSLSFDSTFIFSTDTLALPFLDEFSTSKFQYFQGDFNAAGVTSQTYYRLIYSSNNTPVPNQNTYTNQATFRRVYDINTQTTNDIPFSPVNIIETDFSSYPPTQNPIDLYPPYYIYDTVGIPDVSDTLWMANPAYFQDSATIFFQTISDTSKLWIDRKAYHNFTFADNPRTLGVATFDGLDENGYPYQFGSNITNYGDFLTTKPLDLSPYTLADSLYVSFLYQPEGLGDVPEIGDSLILEFYAPELDQWFHIWSISGSPNHPFKSVHIPVTQAYFMKKGFRMRFKNFGALSGSLDHFHIDYVHLRPLSDQGDTLFKDFAFSYPLHTLLKTYTHVPWDHYRASVDNKMSDGLQVKVHNGSNAAENYQNGQVAVSQNGTPEGTFSLLGFTLAEGNINYNPNTLYTSYHDLSNGYEFNRNLTGNYQEFDIKGSVSAQFPNINSNDSCRFIQGFYNYYSYDDGSAEAAFGPTGAQSMLAIHFDAYEPDSLLGLYLHFVPSVIDVSNKLFYVTVWEDNNGVPGNVLYEDDAFSPRQPTYANGRNNFNAYYFNGNIKVAVGSSFFIGWRQVDPVRYNVGLDRNINHSDQIFYSVDFGGTWETPPFTGSPMVRPIFSTALDGVLSATPKAMEKYTLYPNPTAGKMNIISPFSDEQGYAVYTMQGELVMTIHGNQGDFSWIANGYYLIQSLSHPDQRFKIIRCD
ncbi:MAG: T9SS type A sorting domain-containing protein [Flavobacteriales bacterium]